MSGDSALDEPPTNGSKRRRTATGDSDAPAAKKSFTDAEIAAELAHSLQIREQRREEVRSIYLNYGTLLKGSEGGSEALAFQGLLDCANGSLGARRLAARLVPRFLPRFPSHSEQAFRLLAALYGHGPPKDDSQGRPNGPDASAAAAASQRAGPCAAEGGTECAALEGAMRRDALLGLGNVLEAALRQADRHVPVVMEFVLFLMRHLRRLSVLTKAPTSGTAGATSKAAANAPAQQSPLPPPPPPPQPQPPQPQNESAATSYGHGLKHRYSRRNADAAAHAEANGGGAAAAAAARGRSISRGPSDDEGGGAGRGAQPPQSSPPAAAVPQPRGDVKADGGEADEGGAAAGARIIASADPDSDAGVIRSLLGRAFCLFPRVVLAACFQPFRLPPKQRAAEDCEACELLLELLLLRAAPTATAAAESGPGAEASEGRSVPGAGSGGAGPGGGGCGGSRTPEGLPDGTLGSEAADRGCLVARVLTQLPETQTWLRQLVTALTKGKNVQPMPGSVQAQLDRLLQYCMAAHAPAAAATTAAAAASGKVSPRASPGGMAGPAAGPAAQPSTPLQPASKPDVGTGATVAQSMLGSDDNSRSVPMDLDHSISTAVRPEGSGAAASAAAGGAGAGATGATAAALAGPADTAATPAPPPSPLPQQQPFLQHPQHDAGPAAAPMAPPPAAAPAAPAPPPPLPPPPPPPPPLPSYPSSPCTGLRGGPVCRAEACLYIGGLPPGLTEAVLVSELNRSGAVESVHPFDQQQLVLQHQYQHQLAAYGSSGGGGVPQVPVGEEAYVVFASLRDAAICYEAIARTCRFGGTRPLTVEFCSAFPADSPAARRSVAAAAAAAAAGAGGAGASEFVWVSLSAGAGVTPEAALAALAAAALPVPQQILQVAGRAPGMLLHMASSAVVPQVTACLQSHFTPPPLPPPPAAMAAAAAAAGGGPAALPPPPPPPPPLPPAAAGAMPYGASAPGAGAQTLMPSGAGGPYGPPLHMQPAGGGGVGGACMGGPGGDPQPPLNCRTIWVGQLHEAVRDEELLSACRLHGGEVVGYRFLRGSHCAFVDFASQAAAEAAKRALHGMRLGPQHIRVEWKLDSGPPPRAPLTLRHAGTPLPGGVGTTPVGGGYGIGPTGGGLAGPVAGPPGMGLLGGTPHGAVAPAVAASSPGLPPPPQQPPQPQQPQPPTVSVGLGILNQQLTPQAVAAANVAAAAAAVAARGAFPGGRTGADRWAPVAMPPAPAPPTAPTAAGGATPMAGAGPGVFLPSGQLQPQLQPHLPFGTSALNPAVAAVARQAAPLMVAHQQLAAGAARPHGLAVAAHQLPLAPASAPAAVGSGGVVLPSQPLLSTPPPLAPGHLHSAGSYPGPPPLLQAAPQQLQQQQQQPPPPPQQPHVLVGLQGHVASSLPVHPPHALASCGAPSPLHHATHHHHHHHQQQPPPQPQPHYTAQGPPPQLQLQLQPQHAQSHPLSAPPPRSGDWAQHAHAHAHGHAHASPSLAQQPQRFEPGVGPAAAPPPPLPSSPPPPQDGLTGAPLPLAQLQHPQMHAHAQPQPQPQQQLQQQQQQLPPPPPLQHPQKPQHAAHHHGALQQQQQPAPDAAPPPVVTWQGGLAKSGVHMCTLQCTSGGASAASGATPGEREPVTWPATLDVKLRVDLSYVVHSLYSHTASHARAMRRLVTAGGPEQRNKLSEFLSYLADKNRAGVIKLEAAAGLPPRTLYLVPPSEPVCAALGAEWSAREPFLLALVVPTAGGGAAGGNKG